MVDKQGRSRSLVVWRCGPDVLCAESMDGLFDAERRRRAPRWVVEQLDALPGDRRFDCQGNSLNGSAPKMDAAPEHIPSEADDDLPDFIQA